VLRSRGHAVTRNGCLGRDLRKERPKHAKPRPHLKFPTCDQPLPDNITQLNVISSPSPLPTMACGKKAKRGGTVKKNQLAKASPPVAQYGLHRDLRRSGACLPPHAGCARRSTVTCCWAAMLRSNATVSTGPPKVSPIITHSRSTFFAPTRPSMQKVRIDTPTAHPEKGDSLTCSSQ
jgi:hypothetical protein